jgi:3-hydroxyacyl-[acyl-carrier-protein] dehydratase
MAEMNIDEVLAHLPQRFPMMMIDRVTECEPGKRIVAIKNVSANEPYFQGHFPHRPIMPGVLILEAMAQAAGILVFRTLGTKPDENSVYYYVGIDNARFKKPVVPGDQLELEVRLERQLRGIGKFACVARVAGQAVAEATILCSVQAINGQ